MHPYLLEIAGVKIASYGVMAAIGYGAAVFYLFKKRAQMRLSADELWSLLTAVIIGAVLGGKLLYWIIFWGDYGADFPSRLFGALKDFRYGFVFYGGLMGAFLAGVYQAKRAQKNPLFLADFFAPALALGHGFGRIGCFLAGCCHGAPHEGLMCVKFTNPDSLVRPELLGVNVHPVQLYESFGNFVIFFILNALLKKQRQRLVFGSYLVLYGALRFALEFLRADARGEFILSLSPSQWISVLFALIGGYILRKAVKNGAVQKH